MDFKEAQGFLYSLLDYEKKKTYVESLDPFKEFLERIGNPHHYLKNPVLIVGTKGKGSTSHLISYGLNTLGYKVGLYTSPHLVDIRERIKLNGEKIPEEKFAYYITKLKPFIEKRRGMRTVFETLTSLAFLYFLDEQVDFCILEAGLGGRLDATNVVNQILTVITPISFDHTHILGKKIYQIAREKSAVIKNQNPTVSAPQHLYAMRVIRNSAKKHKSPLYVLGKDAKFSIKRLTLNATEIYYRGIRIKGTFKSFLPGKFQAKNMALAALSLEVLGFEKFDFKKARIEGRFEILMNHPLLVVDGAHNTLSIKSSLESMNRTGGKNFSLIFGINKDKEVRKIVKLIISVNPSYVYITKADTPRAMLPHEIESIFLNYGFSRVKSFSKVSEALRAALSRENKILVTGSFYLAGEVKSLSEKIIASNT